MEPLLLCRSAAQRRDLDLDTAAADFEHWINTGSVALRPSPRRELKFVEFSGHSIEDAQRNAATNLGDGLIGTDVVRNVQETSATSQGESADAAVANVMNRLPAGAFDVQAAKIIQEGESGEVAVTEQEESNARRGWRRQAPRGAELVRLELRSAPKKGLAGIGKKPGTWVAFWSSPYYAEVHYKMSAVVLARYFG